jgi:hypothetical protein
LTRSKLLVLSSLLAVAAIPAAPAQARHGRSLLVVGDSLAVGTRPYIHRHLHGWRIHQHATISMHAPEGPHIMRAYGRHLPRVIFVSLGTNDDPRAVGSFVHQVRKALRIAGPRRCVVWSSIVRPPVAGTSYHHLNRALARLDRKRPRLVMFRWARLAHRHRYWFGSDGVHPNATGYKVRARHMARAIRTCRRIALRHRR